MTAQPPPLRLTTGPGPEYVPAGEPRRGLFAADPVRYTISAPGLQRAVLTACSRTVRPGDELVWAVFPESDPQARTDPAVDVERLFLATGVGLDLVLDDGSRLSDTPASDQHGVGIGPAEQAASKTAVIDQWNLRRVRLDAVAGRTVTAVEVVTQAAAGTGWIELVGIGDPAEGPLGLITAGDGSLAGRALTTRGSHSTNQLSRGLTVPMVSLSQSFCMVTPVSDPATFGQAYHWHLGIDPDGSQGLAAFAVTHVPSPWMGDHGVVQFFPAAPTGDPARAGRAARRLRFRHGDEFARPHTYRVTFADGTQAALAPTSHGLIAEFSRPDGIPAIVFDQIDAHGELDLSAARDGIVTGIARGASDMTTGAVPLHFRAEFDRPVKRAVRVGVDGREGVHGIVEFAGEGNRVTMRLATSFLGPAQATANLGQLPPGSSVASVAAAAAAAWDELLGLVRIDGATPDTTTTLLSNLYRMFLFPNIAHEPGPDGSPRYAHRGPDGAVEVIEGRRSVSNGFWDTYRTIWPALQLLRPDLAAAHADGFVEHFRVDGWMARWSSPGPSDLMVGTSSDNLLADAAVNGVPLPDEAAAYDSALKNASVPAPVPAVGRKGLATGIFTGYIDSGVHEGMSWSLENAISDACLAEFAALRAQRLGAGHPEHADRLAERDWFGARAANHALLFDPGTGFYRGRDAAGRMASGFDPAAWGGDYTETNAWGMRFTAPHDGHGLAHLQGGPAGLGDRLDAFFSTPERATAASQGWYRQIIHEMTEARNVRLGMFGPSNQPAHHIPFMYCFSDRPHRLDPIARECVRRLFLGSELGQGYPGDEDNGEMSAWWFFLALGLYPLWGGSGEYVLCAPSFDRMRVRLPGGELVVEARGNAPGQDHIQSVSVNGQPWTSRAVPFPVVAAGANIVVELGREPAWALTATPPRSLTPAGAAPRRLADAARSAQVGSRPAPALVDDRGATDVTVPPGGVIELGLDGPVVPELLTLTCGDDPATVASAWAIESADDGHGLARIEAAVFRWPRQTRPFRLAATAPVTRLVLRNLGGPAVLRQVEVLAPTR